MFCSTSFQTEHETHNASPPHQTLNTCSFHSKLQSSVALCAFAVVYVCVKSSVIARGPYLWANGLVSWFWLFSFWSWSSIPWTWPWDELKGSGNLVGRAESLLPSHAYAHPGANTSACTFCFLFPSRGKKAMVDGSAFKGQKDDDKSLLNKAILSLRAFW